MSPFNHYVPNYVSATNPFHYTLTMYQQPTHFIGITYVFYHYVRTYVCMYPFNHYVPNYVSATNPFHYTTQRLTGTYHWYVYSLISGVSGANSGWGHTSTRTITGTNHLQMLSSEAPKCYHSKQLSLPPTIAVNFDPHYGPLIPTYTARHPPLGPLIPAHIIRQPLIWAIRPYIHSQAPPLGPLIPAYIIRQPLIWAIRPYIHSQAPPLRPLFPTPTRGRKEDDLMYMSKLWMCDHCVW